MKKIILWSLVLVIILLISIIWFLKDIDTSSHIIPQNEKKNRGSYDLCSYLNNSSIEPDSLIYKFPYTHYLDSADFQNIKSIKSDLRCLDSFSKNANINRQILSNVLTDTLSARYSFETYQPDSVLMLLQWAEKFENYADIDYENDNDIFYLSIYDSWMNFITAKLTNYSIKKPSLKYNFTFKYLSTRCSEKRYIVPLKVTSSEKVIENFIYSKWRHLYQASWNQANVFQKLFVGLVLFCTLYGFYCILRKTFKYIRLHTLKTKTN